MESAALKALRDEVEGALQRWNLSTIAWGWLHGITVVASIVLPLIVAAAASLAGTPVAGLSPWIPVLALASAVAAGLQQGLKPADRWHQYQSDRSEARHLLTEIRGAVDDPAADVAAMRARWNAIDERHQKALP